MTPGRAGFNTLLILAAVNLMALGELIHALMMMNWRPGTTIAQLYFAQLTSAACASASIRDSARKNWAMSSPICWAAGCA